MIMRSLILVGAVGAASMLLSAPAEATTFCQRASVTGVVTQSFGPACSPWSGPTMCDTPAAGVGSIVTVSVTVCVPQILSQQQPGTP
ncbi:MAG: hypothetical protein QOE45_2430 [Frankiaceae bacterium]|jgi:hypothetical protein|nr:hypothetical protein [Frankiaceae bacterium]